MPTSEHICNPTLYKEVKINWPRLMENEKHEYLCEELIGFADDGCGKCFETVFKAIVDSCIDVNEKLEVIKWLMEVCCEPIEGDSFIVDECMELSENPQWDGENDPLTWLRRKQKELSIYQDGIVPSNLITSLPSALVNNETNKTKKVEEITPSESNINDHKQFKIIWNADINILVSMFNYIFEGLHTDKGVQVIRASNEEMRNLISNNFSSVNGNEIVFTNEGVVELGEHNPFVDKSKLKCIVWRWQLNSLSTIFYDLANTYKVNNINAIVKNYETIASFITNNFIEDKNNTGKLKTINFNTVKRYLDKDDKLPNANKRIDLTKFFSSE